jgi:hypothetical protein
MAFACAEGMLFRVSGRNRIAEILLKAGLIDDLQLRSAMGYLSQWGGRLGHALIEKRFATEDDVVSALSQALHLEPIRLGSIPRDAAALAKLDAEFCRDKAVFPVALRDGGRTLLLAMADPTDQTLADEVAHFAHVRVTVALAGEQQIRAAIERLYHGRERAQPPQAPPRPAPPVPEAPETAPAPPSDSPSAGFGPQELAQLQSLVENQEKSGRILRALTELLVEKGYLPPTELSGIVKPPTS